MHKIIKIIVSFSIPIEVKEMLQKIADRTFSSMTKVIVDLIRKEYAFWFDKKIKEGNDGSL